MKVNVMAITTMTMTLAATLGYGYRDESEHWGGD